MARLRDVPTVFGRVGLWGFLKRVYTQTNEDSLFTWAAACAYSWLFAIFPFVIFLLTLVPYLPDKAKIDVRVEISSAVSSLPEGARETVWATVEPHLQDIMQKPRTGLLTFNLILSLFAASGGMNMTMLALDRCYELRNARPFYVQRPKAMAMTIIVSVLALAVAVLLPVGTIMAVWLKARGIPHELLWMFNGSRFLLALIFMVTMVAFIYHWGPNIKQRFRAVSPGTAFTIGIWIALGIIFRFYVAKWGDNSYSKTYGAVGGVVILLFFFYLDACVLLIGAEINSEIDFEIMKIPRGSNDFRVSLADKDTGQQDIADSVA